MKINIHVLSMVRLFLVLLQEGASLPSPNTNEDKQGVFPCITKETRHAPDSKSGAQKTMLSLCLGVGWLVKQPISVLQGPK